MAEKITCVNGNVLKWARLQCGDIKLTSIKEILPQIERWENGEDFPTYAQLEKLANAYKKPIAVFFFPYPPEGISYQAEFRTTSDAEISLLSHKITRLINEALVMQINIQELNPKMKLAEHVLHNKLKGLSSHELESATRRFLNVSLEKQLNTNSPKVMLDIWRNAFFNQGIYVFKEAFHDDSISGFCIYDRQIPIIYLNNSMSFTRQIFTLFHELYHLIHETGGIDRLQEIADRDLSDQQQQIEKQCNKFAAALLVPQNRLLDFIQGRDITFELISSLAERFCVSKESLIIRLIDLHLLDWEFYHAHIQDISTDFKRSSSNKAGGNANYNLISYLGRNYLNLAFSAYREQRIDAFQLASYTKTKVCNGVQREHNKKLNNGLPILHKVPPKRDYGRYFCIMAEKGGTSHGGLTEKLSPFFHAKKQEVNAYGR